MRHALVERHPRESFQLATKLPLRDFKDQEDMEHIFNEQLEHCGVEYFDYYLLHNMGTNVYEKCKKYDAFGFVSRKKAQGQIKNIGMSFHDMPELLEEILTEYGSMLDFIQLQVQLCRLGAAQCSVPPLPGNCPKVSSAGGCYGAL